jgi:hypothetical protein
MALGSILDYDFDRMDITPLTNLEHDIFWGEIVPCTECNRQYIVAADEITHYSGYCKFCLDEGKLGVVSIAIKRNLQALIQGCKPHEWPEL